MDLEQLECFVALTEERHFGRAAERLVVTTSSLSKRCAKLERELGVRLFERTSRQVRVTPAGAVLVDAARRVLADVEALRELAGDAAKGQVGELVIAYSPGNGELVGRIIHELRAERPDVRLRLEQLLSLEVGRAVRTGEASVGICRAVVPSGVEALPISRVYLDHIVVPTDHRLAACQEVGPSDLNGETLLASRVPRVEGGSSSSWHAMGVDIDVRYEPWVTESQVLDSVVAGFGLVVLDEAFLQRNPRPGVVAHPLAHSLVGEPLLDYLLWRPDDRSALVDRFVHLGRSLFADAR